VPPAARVIVGTLRDTVGLFDPAGETVTDREIVPVNPFTLVSVTLADRVNPDPIMRVEGVAMVLKSLTRIIRSTSRDSPPFVPTTLTV
jgi:hypothetical protein